MLAIPAFMLAGDIMSKGGLSKRLVAFARVYRSVYFFCGYFRLVSRNHCSNWRPHVSRSGTLGIVIPPSIVLVIYGNITETDVGALLMAVV